MGWYEICLELVWMVEFVEGSCIYGYQFWVLFMQDWYLDEVVWCQDKKVVIVYCFWEGEDDIYGYLIYMCYCIWVFFYVFGEEDDILIFMLERYLFKVGEYVIVIEYEGECLLFKVVEVCLLIGYL